MPTAVPITPCARLKCRRVARNIGDNQRHNHTESRGRIPSKTCTKTTRTGRRIGEEKTAQRQRAEADNKMGRRPHLSACRPTQGESAATTSCGTMIQAAMSTVAQLAERIVMMLPISGSIAAFAS